MVSSLSIFMVPTGSGGIGACSTLGSSKTNNELSSGFKAALDYKYYVIGLF